MKVRRAIKIPIYPTEAQEILLKKTFGCARFIWNKMLGDEQEFYYAADTHFVPTPAKYKNEYPFLRKSATCNPCSLVFPRTAG